VIYKNQGFSWFDIIRYLLILDDVFNDLNGYENMWEVLPLVARFTV